MQCRIQIWLYEDKNGGGTCLQGCLSQEIVILTKKFTPQPDKFG